jgi:hypothetical protein
MDDLLTFEEVMRKHFKVTPKTGRQFRAQLPGAVRVGRRIKYSEQAILGFIRAGGCKPVA